MAGMIPSRLLSNRARGSSDRAAPAFGVDSVLPSKAFARMLFLERKRAERSGRCAVLMLMESKSVARAGSGQNLLGKVLEALSRYTRDTDAKGWYKQDSVIGVIFTELGAGADGRSTAQALLTKVTKVIWNAVGVEDTAEFRLSFRVFPEDLDQNDAVPECGPELHEDLFQPVPRQAGWRLAKRSMDVAGSLAAMLIGMPLFLAITVAIKATSRGPVLFRQQRVGQNGRKFIFYKFRSMYCNTDHKIHLEFVQKFIADTKESSQASEERVPYKITQDPRVTRVGRFLRKTSLDELPQFLNVLEGDMSLVGPRPPLPYEVECYDAWHKARLLAAKPGITGLWQVNGRSRVKFDEMVRMDLQYAKSWSLWLDLKILVQTPYAVFSGHGAH
jgi:lipopolysaccharide/colanic/teichoic acid biosynthesis glycosyltransferase